MELIDSKAVEADDIRMEISELVLISTMRKFLSISLALALGFFGMIALLHVSKGLSAPSDVGIERTAQLTSVSSTQSNAVEKDGIRFEILVPEHVWLIPVNQPDASTPVRIGIRITNRTLMPVRFTRFDPQTVLGIDIVGADGLALQRQGGRGILLKSPQLACPLTQPEESLTFFLDAKLYWQNNQLQLGGADGLGGGWNFNALKPGTYQIRFKYSSSSSVAPCYDLETINKETEAPRILEGLWTGLAVTPFVKIRLVEP